MKNKINIEKYYKRQIDKELENWSKNTENKTIALISGARRTGKTHALLFLGQTQFDNYEIIEVDKLSGEAISLLTDKTNPVSNFYDFLLSYGISKEIVNSKLLIAFDEIQEHNELKETISYLNANLNCRFACTGSALWINDTNGTRATPDYEPFKVSPFSFVQFLSIIGEGRQLLDEEKNFLIKKRDCDGNRTLQRLIRLYIVVGGMPQIITFYLDHKDDDDLFYDLHKRKRISVVNTYENDLRRYEKQFGLPLLTEYKNIVRNIGIPKDISTLLDTYKKLEDMNIVILSKKINDIQTKLQLSVSETSVKPFLLDVGILFFYYCDSDNKSTVKTFYEKFVSGKDSDNNGYLFENYVASSLIQYHHFPFFKLFTDIENGEEKTYELDFVFSNNVGPIVLEAKSGGDKGHKSLTKALTKYPRIKQSYLLCKSYRFDRNNIQKGPHYIPFYAIDFLLR